MMKNSLLMLFCLLLSLPFACMAEESAEPAMPVFEWERNPAGHWRMLENGEKADLDIHKFGDDLLCTVCGAEVWVYDDLSGDVYNYDAFGNMVRQTSFAGDGTITYDSVRVITYDENGSMTHALEFIDGVLFSETTFALSPNGEIIPVTGHAWYEDGTWALNEYDEFGNCIRAVSYDVDDSVLSEILSEYKQDTDGWYYESKRTTYMDDAVFMTEYNEHYDEIRTLNSDGGLVWADFVYEYEYKDGMKLWCKQYDRGRLSRESIYDPETGALVKETEYYDDNTVTISEFNLIGDPLSITFLTAEGAVDMTQTFEYTYDAFDTQLSCKAYVNGMLVLFSEYAADEDGWTYLAQETLYNEDGSCTIMRFDANEELVSETNYDAQGAVVE